MIKTYEIELHYRLFELEDTLRARIESDIPSEVVEINYQTGILLIVFKLDVECRQIGSFLCYQKVLDIVNTLNPYLGQPERYTLCQK